jgi:hypothetical protein
MKLVECRGCGKEVMQDTMIDLRCEDCFRRDMTAPYAELTLDRSRISIWMQTPTTYPFVCNIESDGERGIAEGVALVDEDDFLVCGEASLIHSVRLLQRVQPHHVILDCCPTITGFLQAIVFVAACDEIARDEEV